jgi:putative membrane-bound dehydrogenase-like protein
MPHLFPNGPTWLCGAILISLLLIQSLAAQAPPAAATSPGKRIVFVAGRPSHAYGAHEHNAGCLLLSRELKAALPHYDVQVHLNGWPEQADFLRGADCLVMYCDGGARHMVIPHLDEVDALARQGLGIVCLHYAVEVPKGKAGERFLDWIGGYFETDWSVNPHWTARFDHLPNHPITRGVQPFEIHDEWYYHMRFREGMQGITPILTALPPPESLSRPDGPHSGNPHVRQAVLQRKEPQHVAWAAERTGGGRGFGFTGGHDHWNWGDPNFRKIVLNAIVWCAHGEVPPQGVQAQPFTLRRLEENLDPKPKPANFDREAIRRRLNLPPDDSTSGRQGSPGDRAVAVAAGQNAGSRNGTDQSAGAAASQAAVRAARQRGEPSVTRLDLLKLREVQRELKLDDRQQVAVDRLLFDQIGGSDPTRDPQRAVENLEVAPGLAVTLFASEPQISNITNIDVDEHGRVWACEVRNYRKHAGERPEGDRILVLEDTDGDGRCDKQTVFYQGRDIDSAHGICVLGSRVIVSALDKVQVFFDEDGDLVADTRREVLFSGISGVQHDHGIHAFIFGPDGKLYFNFGNAGNQLKDAAGKIVVDLAGNEVVARRQPYQEGMVFRCNLDGSQVETLGWNFRNNWEVTVDSFGTMWQSDNDDDGNRGVRINYVMPFGNYGYKDELTGASWKTPRENMEAEIPQQHWHLNDPGVVPTLLLTGAGSPTGICVYEGRLLPEVFWDQVIHCDAGPSVVRAYVTTKDGAGYKAQIVNLLDGSKRDNWFRPSDVCVAPDGSLFVADWYDPGVGGHNQQDVERGRIFRVAPPGVRYTVPSFDFTTPAGCLAALENPALSVRYRAFAGLVGMGEKATEAVKAYLAQVANPRHKARALYVLAQLPGQGEHAVAMAVADPDADLRIVGLRIAQLLDPGEPVPAAARSPNAEARTSDPARQAEPSAQAAVSSSAAPSSTPSHAGTLRRRPQVLHAVEKLVHDSSPQVRRECAIALRHLADPQAARLWAELAQQYPAGDRWYLEALGIGADKQWDEFLEAYLARVGEAWKTPAGRDILWRSRAKKTAELLVKILKDPQTREEEQPRYFRALDFLSGPEKEAALQSLLQ